MNALIRIFFLVMLCLFSIAPVALAQDIADPAKIKNILDNMQVDIDAISDKILKNEIDQQTLIDYRNKLRLDKIEINTNIESVRPVLENVQESINDLGPVPIESETGEPLVLEPDNIKKQRDGLTKEALMVEGVIKQGEALSSKTSRLLEKIAATRRGQFINELFNPQESLFDKDLWKTAYGDYTQTSVMKNMTRQTVSAKNIVGLSVVLVLIISILIFVILVTRRYLNRDLLLKQLSPMGCVSRSLILPLVTLVLGGFALYQVLLVQGSLTDINNYYVIKVLFFVGVLIFGCLVTKRLISTTIIRRYGGYMLILSLCVYVIDMVFLETGLLMGAPVELALAQSYVATTFFAVIVIYCGANLARRRANADASFFINHNIYFLLSLIAGALLIINIFSYASLSRFIFERIVMLALIFLAVVLIRELVRPYFNKIDKAFGNKEEEENSENHSKPVYFWLMLTSDTILLLASAPILFRLFGAEWSDIKEGAKKAFFGFDIGSITISISNMAIAVMLFLFLLFATRLLQRVLSQKIFPQTKLEASVRQSITQVLGYVGLIVALLVGISAIGFDLTNLALIAGALSVGIGFGLQSIVSNFVSGLILLFERPIKVNDWIITNSGEGFVKKISVRATEIETFDRTSIIVPNSELISSSVKNWTHNDKIGRIVVSVGVSYNSDPHAVRQILFDCADSNKDVLKSPAPTIHFKDFADSALIFDVRFFVRNISDFHRISTQMRLDIWDALKKNNVEISYPQRDLHIRTMPEGFATKK